LSDGKIALRVILPHEAN